MSIAKIGEILRKLEYIITSVGSPNGQAYLEVEKIPSSVQQIGVPLGSLYTRSQGLEHDTSDSQIHWASSNFFNMEVGKLSQGWKNKMGHCSDIITQVEMQVKT